jgi:fucose permease
VLILAAIVAIFVYGLIAAVLGTTLPELSSKLSLTPRQNGIVAFSQALGLMVASLAAGPVIDNEGKKIALVAGLLIVSISLLILPKSKSFGTVALTMFFLGIGGGIIVTGANALTSDVSSARRATALNLVNLFFGLGGLITPFLAANILKRSVLRLCYTIAGVSLLGAIVQLMAPIPGPTGAQSFVFSQMGPVLGRPALLVLGLIVFLYISCEVGVWNWLPQHLIAQGIPESRALNVLSLGFALGLLVGRMAVAPVLLTVPAITVTMATGGAIAITSFLLLYAKSANMAWLLAFLTGVSMAPVFPTALSIVADAFPRMTGTALGVAITFGWAGLAVSSRIIGGIAGGDPSRLKKALLLIPASAVLMVVLTVVVRSMLH